jgi:hypothetical protein
VERSLALERPLETQRRHIARGSQCGGGVWSGGGAGEARREKERHDDGRGGEEAGRGRWKKFIGSDFYIIL